MSAEELLNLLKITCSLKEKEALNDFCIILKQFVEENGRIPLLPNDLEQFLKRSNLHADDLVYLLENCARFIILESSISDDIFDLNSLREDGNILNEFKFAAILAAEIQKIITRKYLPELKTINI